MIIYAYKYTHPHTDMYIYISIAGINKIELYVFEKTFMKKSALEKSD